MDAGNYSLKALEPFLLMSKSAKGAAATKLIADATSASGTFMFAELLEMPNIQELAGNEQHASWVELLKVFSYKTWADYKQANASLPSLNNAQSTKLKQLSIVTLAEQSRILSYSDLLAYLDISSVRQLEDLIIDAMYQDVLKGKLDQKEGRLEVEYTIGRDLEPGTASLEQLLAKLQDWSNRTSTVIQSLDVQIQQIQDDEKLAAAAAKEHDAERIAMATQVAEAKRQQPSGPRRQVEENLGPNSNAGPPVEGPRAGMNTRKGGLGGQRPEGRRKTRG
ncbi:COP9 signalosome complex subunit 7b [Ceratobasidium sp. AG-Ba]|nr:COP9 signalosome complex subunit 7b [Ceratobasidium sp. AG-Ba]QRV91759.1 COP9 signalosome complex subunit 7b [Ceratobasidium sp. AG-Ba]